MLLLNSSKTYSCYDQYAVSFGVDLIVNFDTLSTQIQKSSESELFEKFVPAALARSDYDT